MGQARPWRRVRVESVLPPINGHRETGPVGPFRGQRRLAPDA